MRSHDQTKTQILLQPEKRTKPTTSEQKGPNVRQIGTKQVNFPREEIQTVTITVVIDRPIDGWDICTFGIARAFRKNRIETTETITRKVMVDHWIEVPIYGIDYLHMVEIELTEVRTITWDFTAKIPIDFNADFDQREPGRSAGSWREVSRKAVREWDTES
jgi:hypothetical protein